MDFLAPARARGWLGIGLPGEKQAMRQAALRSHANVWMPRSPTNEESEPATFL